jgi:hypothetical protein
MNGVDNLYGQDAQLQNTTKLGIETNEYMRMANKDIRDQRDVLFNVT